MERPKIGRIFASQNDTSRRDPGDDKYGLGWIAEIPTYQVLNFLQYRVDTFLLALAERGVTSWGADIAYTKGALAFDDSNGVLYTSLVANPSKTQRPSANSNQWSKSAAQIGREEFDSISASITAHIANMANPHKLTTQILDTLNAGEINSLATRYYQMVNRHVQDKNNPHKVNATQIGAVPTTGGTYTGEVTFQTGRIPLGTTNKNAIESTDTSISFRAGDNSIDINSDGSATITRNNSKENLITSKTFASYEATQQIDYQVPEPMFYQPFMNGLEIIVGDGVCNTSYDPAYGNGAKLAVGSITYQDTTLPTVPCTFSIDIQSDFKNGRATLGTHLNFGCSEAWLGSAGDVRLPNNSITKFPSLYNNVTLTYAWVDGVEFGTTIYDGDVGSSKDDWNPQSPKFSLVSGEDLYMEVTITLDADGTINPMVRTDGNGAKNHQIQFGSTAFKAGVPQTLSRTATNTEGDTGYFQVSHMDFKGTVTVSHFRIARRSKVQCQLYVNGVYAESAIMDYSAVQMSMQTVDNSSDIYISNLRAWDICLSNKQVSNI